MIAPRVTCCPTLPDIFSLVLGPSLPLILVLLYTNFLICDLSLPLPHGPGTSLFFSYDVVF